MLNCPLVGLMVRVSWTNLTWLLRISSDPHDDKDAQSNPPRLQGCPHLRCHKSEQDGQSIQGWGSIRWSVSVTVWSQCAGWGQFQPCVRTNHPKGKGEGPSSHSTAAQSEDPAKMIYKRSVTLPSTMKYSLPHHVFLILTEHDVRNCTRISCQPIYPPGHSCEHPFLTLYHHHPLTSGKVENTFLYFFSLFFTFL